MPRKEVHFKVQYEPRQIYQSIIRRLFIQKRRTERDVIEYTVAGQRQNLAPEYNLNIISISRPLSTEV